MAHGERLTWRRRLGTSEEWAELLRLLPSLLFAHLIRFLDRDDLPERLAITVGLALMLAAWWLGPWPK